jgi:N-acetylated-alpha-linked acidic dipeptidase
MVNQVAADVRDPELDVTLLARWGARRAVGGAEHDGVDLPISALGSGSDYTPFLQHLGIASLNVGMGGESGGGSYHSVYDSYDHYSRFIDPGFTYGATLAKVTGRLTLRFANADVLPHRFTNFAETVRRYVDEVETLADDLRAATNKANALIEEGAYELAADPRKPFVEPETHGPVPFINFAPLHNALTRLETAAAQYDRHLTVRLAAPMDEAQASRVNAVVLRSERALSDAAGLPKRPWFRHTIYAPGFYTGYGVKTLPGVREAIEQREWELVDGQMARIAGALEELAALLEESARILTDAPSGP